MTKKASFTISALAFLMLAPAQLALAGYGFVWANRATTASYTPSLSFQHNSSGRTNTIRRIRTGYYQVFMPLVMSATHGGNVQVSAYGTGSNYCKAGGWYRQGTADLRLDVFCFSQSGLPVDTRFTTLYHDNEAGDTDLAYAWADQPTARTYTPHGYYRFNAGPPDPAGHLFIFREGLGRYLVLIHGWSGPERTFLVTAYGSDAERCNVRRDVHEEAFVTNGDYWIRRHALFVACHRPDGSPVDTMFTVANSRHRVFGTPRTVGAYLFAHRPTAASHFSRAEHAFNPLDWGSPQIRRLGRGRYEVDLFQLGGSYGKSTALVTAQSETSDYCKVRSWSGSGSNVRVGVDCYSTAGVATDTAFFLSFITDETF